LVRAFKLDQKYKQYKQRQKKSDEKLDYDNDNDEENKGKENNRIYFALTSEEDQE
jgi:hypothetical protein